MLILHIYIKLNRLLHCFLTSASIHDYLFWFLCKMAYKHGAGILSACQWVCFQWQPMALIIILILQGLYQECSPKRPQLVCHSVRFPGFFTLHLPRRCQWLQEFDTTTVLNCVAHIPWIQQHLLQHYIIDSSGLKYGLYWGVCWDKTEISYSKCNSGKAAPINALMWVMNHVVAYNVEGVAHSGKPN